MQPRKEMSEREQRMVQHHQRTYATHHLTHAGPHITSIAVNAAILAVWLMIIPRAIIKTRVGIGKQLPATLTQHFVALASAAIKPYHQLYGSLLTCYGIHKTTVRN